MSLSTAPVTVTFVCTGNICRSPIAEVIVADMVRSKGLDQLVRVDSGGVGDWHVGEQADPRAVAVLSAHGLDGTQHRARQVDAREVHSTDLMVALDRSHLAYLHTTARTPAERAKVKLLRSFDPQSRPGDQDIVDPYYGDAQGFSLVFEQIQRCAPGLVIAVEGILRARLTTDLRDDKFHGSLAPSQQTP